MRRICELLARFGRTLTLSVWSLSTECQVPKIANAVVNSHFIIDDALDSMYVRQVQSNLPFGLSVKTVEIVNSGACYSFGA